MLDSRNPYLIGREIDDILDDLLEYSNLFNDNHKKRLKSLCFDVLGETDLTTLYAGHENPIPKNTGKELFTVDEVSSQYQLVRRIRSQLVDTQGNLLDGADPRMIASLVSSINSLISLFLKSQEKIDHLKEVANLRESVVAAISNLPKENQELFFTALDNANAKQ